MLHVIAGLIPNSPVPFRVTSTAQQLLDLHRLLCLYIRREGDRSEQSGLQSLCAASHFYLLLFSYLKPRLIVS